MKNLGPRLIKACTLTFINAAYKQIENYHADEGHNVYNTLIQSESHLIGLFIILNIKSVTQRNILTTYEK